MLQIVCAIIIDVFTLCCDPPRCTRFLRLSGRGLGFLLGLDSFSSRNMRLLLGLECLESLLPIPPWDDFIGMVPRDLHKAQPQFPLAAQKRN